MEKNFSVNLNNQATVENQTKSSKDDYVNLNCYKVVDGQPVWLFRVSTVPTQRVNTEAFLQKQLVEVAGSREQSDINRFVQSMPIVDSKYIREFLDKNEPRLDLTKTVLTPSGKRVDVAINFGVEFFRVFF